MTQRHAGAVGARRLGELDALRGVAALLIVFHHLWALSFGTDLVVGGFGDRLGDALNVGVPVFFALSGFVIYAPFARARRSGRSVALVPYAIRRFMRIAPPYWVLLTVLALVFGLAGVLTADWWRYYGFAQVYSSVSLPPVGPGRPPSPGLVPAWTLCVEMSFYVFVPVYAAVVSRLGLSLVKEVALLTVAIGLSLLCRRWVYSSHDAAWSTDHTFLLSLLPTTFLWFVPGLILATFAAQPVRQPRVVRSWDLRVGWAIAAVAFALCCVQLPSALEAVDAAALLRMVVAAGLVAPLVLRGIRGDGVAWLRTRPLILLGTISYSVYLVHYPIIAWLRDRGIAFVPLAIIAVPVVLTVAWIANRLIERPSHELGRTWARAIETRDRATTQIVPAGSGPGGGAS